MGLTRAQVADRAGVEKALLTYIEEEPASVRAEIVLRLAYAANTWAPWPPVRGSERGQAALSVKSPPVAGVTLARSG